MTAPELLGLITAALVLQVALGVVVVLRRARAAVPVGALAAVAPSDRLAMPQADQAWAGWRDFRVSRRVYEDAAQTQCSFYLEPVDGQPLPPFKPGQFLSLSLELTEDPLGPAGAPRSNSRLITRCYSLSDRPDPAHYRITVKRVPAPAHPPGLPPGLASNHLHDHIQPGAILRVRPPAGHFFIDGDAQTPVVLIGGGIGITPMMSMLRWCLAAQPGRTVHLFYGLRNGREHAFQAVLRDLAAAHPALHLHIAYSRPEAADVPGRDFTHPGHVDLDLLRRTLPHGRHRFYLCGPTAMMQSLVPALAQWGVPAADVQHEAFGPASLRAAAPAAAVPAATVAWEIRFARSGRTLAWDGRDASLLEFAERHGIALESGCRAGACGSCLARLVTGGVHYTQTPDVDVPPGHCLPCVCRPTTAMVLEA